MKNNRGGTSSVFWLVVMGLSVAGMVFAITSLVAEPADNLGTWLILLGGACNVLLTLLQYRSARRARPGSDSGRSAAS